MQPRTRIRLFLALTAMLCGVLACNCGGGAQFNANGAPDDAAPQAEIKPRFTIDCGLKDAWGQKKSGPSQMAVSPDGKYLLTMTSSNKDNVQIWDMKTHQKLHAIRDDIGTMYAPIAIASDSKTAAYLEHAVAGGKIIILDLTTGNRIRAIADKKRRLNSFVKNMVFSPRGDLLLMAYDGGIIGWDVATGAERFTWGGQIGLRRISRFFDDGRKIASITNSGQITIWDVAGRRPEKTLQAGGGSTAAVLAVTGDGQTLITRAGGPFKFWDLATGNVRHEIQEITGTFAQIVPFPDNRTAAWATNSGFLIYDLQSGAKKQEIKTAHDNYLRSITVTPDGSLLLTAGGDGLIKGWSINANGMVE